MAISGCYDGNVFGTYLCDSYPAGKAGAVRSRAVVLLGSMLVATIASKDLARQLLVLLARAICLRGQWLLGSVDMAKAYQPE